MRPVKLETSDFRLTFETQRWAEETYEKFPVLRWPSGAICEPATLYFGWSLEYRRGLVVSSLKPEAYFIREWLTYLVNKGIQYDQIDDRVLRSFREFHVNDVEQGKIHIHQVERKLAVVYQFYRALDEILAFDWKGIPRKRLVAPDASEKSYAVTTAIYKSKSGTVHYVWSGSKAVSPKRKKRPTPGIDEVETILSWVRSNPDRMKAAGQNPTEENFLMADRDWLMARSMSAAGLRRKEVAELPLKSIWQLLRDENIMVPSSINEFADPSPEVQRRILKDLEERNAQDSYTEIEICGKGGKIRYAPTPVIFVIDLLRIWIWGWRKSLLPKILDVSLDRVFLSVDGAGLKAGSVGDKILFAFKGANVSGSGHRLRAHYCTVTAIRLWEEEMQRSGFNFSQAVYNVVLDRLADAMGHSKVSTSVRYYLDLAVAKYFGFSSRAKYVAFSRIWQAVADNYSKLSSSDIRMIVNFVKTFAKPGTDQLKAVMTLALENAKLNPDSYPSSNVAASQHLPRLKLAFDRENPAVDPA